MVCTGMEGVVRFLDAADSVHCLKEQFHISRNGGCGEVPWWLAPGSLLPDRSHHRLEVQGGPAVRVLQRGVHRYGILCLADPDPARIRSHFGRLDPDPDPHCEYGSGSRRVNMTHKSEENSSFEVLDVFFWGMKTSPVAWKSYMET